MDKLEQMRAAVARLNEAADAYYNGRAELMTDFEWDALFDKVPKETNVCVYPSHLLWLSCRRSSKSPVVQWLRRHTCNAGSVGWIPSQ